MFNQRRLLLRLLNYVRNLIGFLQIKVQLRTQKKYLCIKYLRAATNIFEQHIKRGNMITGFGLKSSISIQWRSVISAARRRQVGDIGREQKAQPAPRVPRPVPQVLLISLRAPYANLFHSSLFFTIVSIFSSANFSLVGINITYYLYSYRYILIEP